MIDNPKKMGRKRKVEENEQESSVDPLPSTVQSDEMQSVAKKVGPSITSGSHIRLTSVKCMICRQIIML